jgi:iron complex outermembrane receptor protein
MKFNNQLSLFAVSSLSAAIALVHAPRVNAAQELETVIVTASKIEQDVQQTPVSLSSISGDKLTELGATSVQDIAKLTPGLQMDQTGAGISATVRIRGIGTPGYSALDPSVPIFIDGVAQARTGSGFQDLLDVARIEVLRGPQGTLYGRNSTAGAINVWTKDANSHRWDGSIQVQQGNYNDREMKSTVNIPIVDDLLAARVSVYSVHQDGYLNDPVLNTTENGFTDRYGARAKILLTPTPDFSVQWLTAYSNSTSRNSGALTEAPSAYTMYANSPGGIVSQGGTHTLAMGEQYNGNVYGNTPTWGHDTDFATSFTMSWDISSGLFAGSSITSITAYDLYKDHQISDQDNSILDWSSSEGQANTQSWSQEVRLSSDATENLEYVLGLFYYADRVLSNQFSGANGIDVNTAFDYFTALSNASPPLDEPGHFTSPIGNPYAANTHDWFNSDNAAIFGQATYEFTDKFSVTAGLRESWVQKRGNSSLTANAYIGAGNFYALPPQDIVDHATLIETDTSGVLKARYFIENDFMVYGSIDKGFKPGGFNRLVTAGNDAPTSYDKETSTNYEIGAKTSWFDNRLQANIAAFYMEFKDYHNQITDQFSNLIIENVPKISTDGIELDIAALPLPDLKVGIGAAYLNPRVRDTVSAQKQTEEHYVSNLHNGELLNDVSQYSANINAEYSHRLPDSPAEGFVGFDTAYRSEYILGDLRDGVHQGGFTLSNMRAGVRNLDNHWELTGWVRNMFNKEYAISGSTRFGSIADAFEPSGFSITQGAPRTYGMTVKYDY